MQKLSEILLNKKKYVDFSVLRKLVLPYKKPCHSIKDFKKSLKIKEDEGYFSTPIGDVAIRTRSQFLKLANWKEDRIFLSGIYAETLKNPLFITKDNGAIKFYGIYKINGGIIHNLIVADTVENGTLAIKTCYAVDKMTKIKNLILTASKEELYRRNDIAQICETAQAHEVEPKDVVVSEILQEKCQKVNHNKNTEDTAKLVEELLCYSTIVKPSLFQA